MLKAKVLILKRSSGEGKSARIANTGNLSSASSSVRNESKMREKGKSGCLRKVTGAGIPGMVVKGEAGSAAAGIAAAAPRAVLLAPVISTLTPRTAGMTIGAAAAGEIAEMRNPSARLAVVLVAGGALPPPPQDPDLAHLPAPPAAGNNSSP